MRSNAGRIIVAAVGGIVIALIVSLMAYRQIDQDRAPSIVITDNALQRPLVVMVDGAVMRPGTFELPAGSRLQHAIDAAGGTLTNAELADQNMARLLVDGERITIPLVELAPTLSPGGDVVAEGAGAVEGRPQPSPTVNATVAPPDTTDSARPININTADVAELETLPGIGPALAARIVSYRTDNGAFQSVDELDDVSGISARMVDELRDQITV